jgi:hypothetical protein
MVARVTPTAFVGEHRSAFGAIMIQNRVRSDSPLEQSGFEPLVPLTLDGTKATEKG